MAPILRCLDKDGRFRVTIASTVDPASLNQDSLHDVLPYAPESCSAQVSTTRRSITIDPETRYAAWYDGEARSLVAEAETALAKAGSWLAHLDPCVIVGCVSPTAPIREIILAARMMGISTVNMEHGVSSHVRNDVDDGMTLRFYGKWAESLLFDHFGCWGEAIREVMIRHGWRQERLFVPGAPDFDRIAEYRSARFRAESRARLEIAENARVIALLARPLLFAAREYPTFCLASRDEVARWYEILFSAVAELPDANLLVKNHPVLGVGPEEELQRALAPPGAPIRWVNVHEDIWRVVAAADLVVGHPGSTTDFHALALGRPLVSLMLPAQTQRYMIVENGLSPCARNRDRLLSLLKAPVSPPAAPRDEFLARYLGPLDGRASARVVDQLARLAGGRKGREAP
jgi:hypothetical protein